MIRISQFWINFAAGKPLGLAWQRKYVEIALHDLGLLDELPLNLWMRISEREQRRLLRQARAAAAEQKRQKSA